MAKDFVDTQTGGEGVTSQVGDLSLEENQAQKSGGYEPSKETKKGIRKQKREDRRDDRKENREERKDDRKEKREARKSEKAESPAPSKEPQLDEEVMVEAEEEVVDAPEIPMIAPMESAEASEDVEEAKDFSFSFNNPITEEQAEIEDNKFKDDGSFNFSFKSSEEKAVDAPEENLLALPENMKPWQPPVEGEEEEAEESYSYGDSDNKYVQRGNKWYKKTPNQSMYHEVAGKDARATYLALNASAISSKTGKKASPLELPKQTFKPKRGGEIIDGAPIYQFPGNVNWIYTTKGDDIFVKTSDDEEWKNLKDTKSKYPIDKRYEAFRDYHGLDILTPSEREEMAYKPSDIISEDTKDDPNRPKPGQMVLRNGRVYKTVKGYDEQANPTYYQQEANLTQEQINKGLAEGSIFDYSKRNIPLRRTEVEPKEEDVVSQAQEALEERQAELGHTPIDIKYDSEGNPVLTRVSGDLFSRPRPDKSDPGAQYQWDSENGELLPPLKDNIEKAIKGKDEANIQAFNQVSDWVETWDGKTAESIVLKEGTPNEYKETLDKHINDIIPKHDEEIKKQEDINALRQESFDNRNDYISKHGLDLNEKFKDIEDIKSRLNHLNYGLYQDDAAEQMSEAYEDLIEYKKNENEAKLQAFIDRDIDEWAINNNLSDSQKEQLKDMKKRAALEIKLGGAAYSNIEDEVNSFLEESYYFNNKMAEAEMSGLDLTDYLLEERKSLYEEVKGRGLINDETAEIFESTMRLRDVMSSFIDEGKVRIDDGKYVISDNVKGLEREYIEARLGALLEDYKTASSKVYINNTKVIEEKSAEIKSLKASIAKTRKNIASGKVKANKDIYAEITEHQKRVDKLNREIKELKNNNSIVFQTDPDAKAMEMSENLTQSSVSILRALPEEVTGFQKFALFYQKLWDETEAMRIRHGISEDKIDRLGEKLRDMANIDLGMKLEPYEIEFFKNQEMLRQSLPLMLNNDSGITEESNEFWVGLLDSLLKGMMPHVGSQGVQTLGYNLSQNQAASQLKMIENAGMTEQDFRDGATIDKYLNQIKVESYSAQWWGQMTGNSLAIMLPIFA
ncbi:MAG: hypothetical protein ACW99G_20290, partial [Candidatus Thorarchaeota archaeon]